MKTKISVITFLFIALLALSACATAPAPTADSPTVNSDEIIARAVDEALAEIQTRQAPPEEIVPALAPESSALAAEAGLEDRLINLYAETNPAVVYIVVPGLGSGSGFVYDDQGHIVTNNHVVEGGSDYEVVFANGERRRATLVGTDPDSDLAVIQVNDLPAEVEPLPLAAADEIAVGQFVVAIGNPFGEQGSMSLGIVSGLDRSLRSQRSTGNFGGSTYSLPEVIQTDAPINPGNSGGPLLNLDGEVVGINAAIRSTTGTGSGVGFSIPVAAVRLVAPSLIAGGSYDYPFLGASFASDLSLDNLEELGLDRSGAYLMSLANGGPAARAGLQAGSSNTGQGGDLIIALDGQEIRSFDDLNSYLVFNTTVGQTIEVTVLRDGREVALPLTLGERP